MLKMSRNSSNASDVFSKYLSPLDSKGEPSKDAKKRTLPPTLPRKQLVQINEQNNIDLNNEMVDGNIQNEYTCTPRSSTGDDKIIEDGVYDSPSDFNPRQFNANYDATLKDQRYKEIIVKVKGPGSGTEDKGSPNFTRRQFPPQANGETSKHDLGFTENNPRSSVRNRSARNSSMRDVVDIRRRINDHNNQVNRDGTFSRYVYLDRGNTWCLRVSLLICIIAIVILFILVANNTSRLSTIEGT